MVAQCTNPTPLLTLLFLVVGSSVLALILLILSELMRLYISDCLFLDEKLLACLFRIRGERGVSTTATEVLDVQFSRRSSSDSVV